MTAFSVRLDAVLTTLPCADTVLGVEFDWPGVTFPAMPEDKRQMEEWCVLHSLRLLSARCNHDDAYANSSSR